ncbi:AAA family ATPase [Photobacterium leiognathi]|uniref:AAA family ATPase n=1 Tax=Photobacterium leiognathi TaxID=553611 RepID=UPI002739CDA9|nr:AAA family ATPase [Photobacterium leiognathi]
MNLSVHEGFSFPTIKLEVRSPLELLSSGERNQVSIFFDLIFNARDGSIILIDEPEISLHISWQKSLLKEFERISKFNYYSQLIIATHSPDVISDDWELSIDLYDKHEIFLGDI